MSESTATLVVGGFRSTCSACRRNADPYESAHLNEAMQGPGCGAVYTAISSSYVGMDERLREMRPDLPLVGGAA